jgi:hypothetical protein
MDGEFPGTASMIERVSLKLSQILAEYGLFLCDDPKRCEALLLEEYPQFSREVRVLIRALERGMIAELRSAAQGTPWEQRSVGPIRRLIQECGYTEDMAKWAVESWGQALGLETREEKPLFGLDSQELTEDPDTPKNSPKGERIFPILPRAVWHMFIVGGAGSFGGAVLHALTTHKGSDLLGTGAMVAAFFGGGLGGALGWMFSGGQSWTYDLYGGSTLGRLGLAVLGAFQGAMVGAYIGFVAGAHFSGAEVGAIAGTFLGTMVFSAFLAMVLEWRAASWWGPY